MKKLLSFFLMTVISTATMFAARNWTSVEYQNQAVAYVALVDGDGNPISVGENTTLGAFIGDECRGIAEISTVGTTTASSLFTLRIGVNPDEGTQNVTLVVKCNETEYTLSSAITVDGTDQTFGEPSTPLTRTLIAATALSLPETLEVNVGGTVNLLDNLTITPSNANLPDEIVWEYGNSKDYIKVENNVLTGLKANRTGAYLGVSFGAPNNGMPSAYTNVIVNQPITGIALSPNYTDPTIHVDIYDSETLTNALKSIIVITPDDATETVVWVPSDETAFEVNSTVTNGWTPVKAGTFTMTATAVGGAKFPVTVIVRQPVEKYAQFYETLTVTVGTVVSDLLPHTFALYPETATDPMSGISYAVSGTDDQGNDVLSMTEGVITAEYVGSATVTVTHSDIPNMPWTVSVNVVKLPTEADFSISQDPLVIEVAQDLLGTLDITSNIQGNIKTGEYAFDALVWAENYGEGTPVLTINGNGSTAAYQFIAAAYGTSRIEGTITTLLSGFDGKGNFSNAIPNVFTTGFGIQITQALSAISFEPITIGCEDTYELVITTTPENYPLADVSFAIPTAVEDEDAPYFALTRVGNENKWTLEPKLVGESRLTATVGNLSDTQPVKITQRVNLGEGWNWLSLYSGTESADAFSKNYANAQEVRSQTQLMYNDPKFGFFGSLVSLDNSSFYRVKVKEGQTVAYLAENTDLFSNESKEVSFKAGWTWFSNRYCKNRNFQEVFGKVILPANSYVIAQTGFMTFDSESSTWVGTLKSLNVGEGYLVYNAGDAAANVLFMPDRYLTEYQAPESGNSFDIYSETPDFNYNPNQFAENMCIVAEFAGNLEPNRYAIGAFVDGECRGEGKMIGNRFFITVAGQSQDVVNFELFDRATGNYITVDNSVNFTKLLGTLSEPAILKAEVTGVDMISKDGSVNIGVENGNIVVDGAEADNVKVYTVSGQQVSGENLASGVYVVKVATENGVITRKIVK